MTDQDTGATASGSEGFGIVGDRHWFLQWSAAAARVLWVEWCVGRWSTIDR
jgi:hypothetical protein